VVKCNQCVDRVLPQINHWGDTSCKLPSGPSMISRQYNVVMPRSLACGQLQMLQYGYQFTISNWPNREPTCSQPAVMQYSSRLARFLHAMRLLVCLTNATSIFSYSLSRLFEEPALSYSATPHFGLFDHSYQVISRPDTRNDSDAAADASTLIASPVARLCPTISGKV
jgi:hypothetical protein